MKITYLALHLPTLFVKYICTSFFIPKYQEIYVYTRYMSWWSVKYLRRGFILSPVNSIFSDDFGVPKQLHWPKDLPSIRNRVRWSMGDCCCWSFSKYLWRHPKRRHLIIFTFMILGTFVLAYLYYSDIYVLL